MDQPDISKATIDRLMLSFIEQKEIEIDILRLDRIHPVISGNKWFKLKYHLQNYYTGNYKGILTFGGAWSNHIAAVACACNQQKIKCAGVIRGEKPANLSLTLQEAANYNMDLKFISREIYKKKNTDDFLKEIKKEFSNYYIIPEGGAGDDGEKGAGEILNLVTKHNYSHIACAIGTATMFNGISKSLNLNQLAIGIPVLKGFGDFPENTSANIFSEYHFGGYAKANEELFGFMNDFFEQTTIPTDFVYTGKLTFAICDLVKNNFFPKESKVLIIHSGGLQGNLSLPKGTLIF